MLELSGGGIRRPKGWYEDNGVLKAQLQDFQEKSGKDPKVMPTPGELQGGDGGLYKAVIKRGGFNEVAAMLHLKLSESSQRSKRQRLNYGGGYPRSASSAWLHGLAAGAQAGAGEGAGAGAAAGRGGAGRAVAPLRSAPLRSWKASPAWAPAWSLQERLGAHLTQC